MTNQRRVTIIVISVMVGSIMSYFVFKLRRGGGELTGQDLSMLFTNLFFSLLVILGVGYMFIWRKKKDL